MNPTIRPVPTSDPTGLPQAANFVKTVMAPPQASQPSNPIAIVQVGLLEKLVNLNTALSKKFPKAAVTVRLDVINPNHLEYSVYVSGFKHPIHPDKIITSTDIVEVQRVVDGVLHS